METGTAAPPAARHRRAGCTPAGATRATQLGDGTTSARPSPTKVVPDALWVMVAAAAGSRHTGYLSKDGQYFGVGSDDHGELGFGSDRDVGRWIAMAPLLAGIGVAAGCAHSLLLTYDPCMDGERNADEDSTDCGGSQGAECPPLCGAVGMRGAGRPDIIRGLRRRHRALYVVLWRLLREQWLCHVSTAVCPSGTVRTECVVEGVAQPTSLPTSARRRCSVEAAGAAVRARAVCSSEFHSARTMPGGAPGDHAADGTGMVSHVAECPAGTLVKAYGCHSANDGALEPEGGVCALWISLSAKPRPTGTSAPGRQSSPATSRRLPGACKARMRTALPHCAGGRRHLRAPRDSRGFRHTAPDLLREAYASRLNLQGLLADGTRADHHTPVRVLADHMVIGISTSNTHSLFVTAAGAVYSSGNNTHGALGDGSFVSSAVPVKVRASTTVVAASAGYHPSLFLHEAGSVLAVVSNDYGQLGLGYSGDNDEPYPVEVPFVEVITTVSAGRQRSICVERNGQLGNGILTNAPSPARMQMTAAVDYGFIEALELPGEKLWESGATRKTPRTAPWSSRVGEPRR
ncbi:hypothetical protein CYMTET_36846 [Cymbomonas tetramitiformis]|uniref:Uncharacterized protein n=1 Tax=Cymbomonas tetramitiformis TaxID=36881 RepID=A0AAE0CGX0_9CHLO|nr:hypothetical protein CYMTET_36846 [Cymbomonas tetramitiformis]